MEKMQKKLFILAILVSFLVVGGMLYAGIGDWIIDGDRVYVDDENVYISAHPHTLKGSGWVTFNFTSKVYTGLVDMVFGFDTDSLVPQEINLYNPTTEIREKNYTCNGFFNYTTDPPYFWCYGNETYYNNETQQNQTDQILAFHHEYDYALLPIRTAFWNETYIDKWKDYSSVFNSINHNYEDMNKWWYKTNIPIIQGNEYIFRVKLKNNQPWNLKSKYWFAIKPSSETLQEAISSGHLYALDPWTVGLDDGLFMYHNCSSSDAVVGDSNFDLEVNVSDPIFASGEGKIGDACDYDGNDMFQISENNQMYLNHSGENTTISFWLYKNDTTDGLIWSKQYTSGWKISYDTGQHLDFGDICGSGIVLTDEDTTINTEQWYHVAMTKNDTHCCYWLDSDMKNCTADGSVTTFDIITLTGGDSSGATQVMKLDEIGFWNRTLSSDEISDLYNSGDGITYSTGELYPNISILYPTNNSWFSYNTADVNYTYEDDKGVDSCWYSNGTYAVNTTLTNCETNITDVIWADGTDNVRIYINDTLNNLNFTAVTLSIDTIYPNATIVSPSGTESSKTITINITGSNDTNLDTCIYNITRGASTEVSDTEITNCINTTATMSSDASYVMWLTVNDSANNINITNSSFTVSSSSSSSSSSGGGGGGGTTETTEEDVKVSICIGFKSTFDASLKESEEMELFERISYLWNSFWNFILCESASSIVPI